MSLPNPIVLFRPGIAALVMCAWTTTSGCVTTLGYVPEHLKPSNTRDYVPTYSEVKKWAFDVVDGYGSRAVLNRRAIQFGAIFAAAAAGTLLGLAAFDSQSPAIKGIPIGTTFLGGAAAIYSSEEKAVVYGLASQYVKDLIVLSDERIIRRTAAALNPDAAITEATGLQSDAQKKLKDAMEQEELLRANALKARADAIAAPPNTPDRAARDKLADNAETLAAQAASAVANAKEELDDATARLKNLKRLKEFLAIVQTAEKNLETATKSRTDTADVEKIERELKAAKLVVDPETAEALCLRNDVNDVMRRVEELKALLDPKNIAERLRLVGKKDTKSAADKTAQTVTPGDLSDLRPPVKSRCKNEI